MSTVSVVLVSQDEDLRSSFRSIVGELQDVSLVGALDGTRDLAPVLDDDEVDVVVVDEVLAEMPALDLVRTLVQTRPLLAVLVLSREPDAAALGAAIEAGARGVVSAPLSLQDLQARLDSAAGWSRTLRSHVRGEGGPAGRRGRVVALAGAKGGVGTSVLSVLLAQQSLLPGRTVCLVDLDLRQGDLAYYTGVTARRSIADLADVAGELTGRSVREVVNDVPAGFAVLTAPEDVERAEDVDALSTRQILTQLRMQFELVVVDVGASLDEAGATALEMADDVVLVVGTDVVSLRAARRCLTTWERLAIRQRHDVRLVVNMVSRRREVQPELAQRIVHVELAGAVPEACAELEPAVNTGTLVTARPGSTARAVRDISERLGLRDAEPAGRSRSEAVRADQASRRGRGARRRAAAEAGQASLELPVVLLLFAAVFLLCAQGLVLGTTHILARHAAAEVAREASVEADGATVDAAARNALPLAFGRDFDVSVDQGSRQVAVRVATPRIIPLPGGLDLDVRATTGFQPEPS